MPNAIKYNTGSETLALKKGNFWIATGDVGKGPTDTTGYYNGISPPSGGYTIYLNKVSGGPSIYTVSNDSGLISLTNTIAGTSYTTINECFNYFNGQSDKMVVQRDYESIVTNGLVFNVDAGFIPSFPQNGSTWNNLSIGGNNASLINGPSYNSSGGGNILFDGVDDYATVNQTLSTPITMMGFVKYNNQSQTLNTWINSYPHTVIGFSLNRNGFGQLQVYIGNGSYWLSAPSIVSSTNMTVNTWYHICFVSDGNGSTLYLNNTNVGTSQYSPSGWGAKFYLGWIEVATKEYLNGNIGLTQIYNRALSTTEITQNYNAQKGRYGL